MRQINGCLFTIVAADDDRKPAPAAPLRPFTPDDQPRYAHAAASLPHMVAAVNLVS
jgi:acyl-CoA hydrolase